jgi:hypothetical protein
MNCNCGKAKPYRRAFACGTCWPKLSAMVGFLVEQGEPRRKGYGTLRFGGKAVDAVKRKGETK